jgi:aminopeptidase N
MSIKLTAPKDLVGVANGRLKHVEDLRDNKTYHWFVTNPINNYGVNVNLARYVNFSDSYQGEKGKLDLDYYVLPHNLEKAREHFKQVPLMLAAFEHWFGPYPFYEDSFKIVETPYLGMEHQSSITYGNGYQNGYLGYDRSGTGWGLKFDYIIIHEAGHEWFANNITYRDMADLWIHEAFTNYSEALYLDYHYGKEAAAEYIIGLRNQIYNDKPIIAPYGVNQAGSVDVYNKGANMLHTLRYLINNDSLWRQILRGLNSTFYHQTVSTEQIENYISQASGMDLDPFFDQYLRTSLIPVLEYRLEGDALHFRYADVVRGFEMPIRVEINGKPTKLKPGKEWQSKHFSDSIKTFEVDGNYYVDTRKVGRS